jgi:hypothetical protein
VHFVHYHVLFVSSSSRRVKRDKAKRNGARRVKGSGARLEKSDNAKRSGGDE